MDYQILCVFACPEEHIPAQTLYGFLANHPFVQYRPVPGCHQLAVPYLHPDRAALLVELRKLVEANARARDSRACASNTECADAGSQE